MDIRCWFVGHDLKHGHRDIGCERCGLHPYWDNPGVTEYRGEGNFYAAWGGLWWLGALWNGGFWAPKRALLRVLPARCPECGDWRLGINVTCDCRLPF